MITAVFSVRNNKLCGFYISGHSGLAPIGKDILCSAVSSAVYLTANTLAKEDKTLRCQCDDGLFTLYTESEISFPLLWGLRDHLKALQKQYPQYMHVYNLILNGGNTNV